jgi:EAL domain-containing protein (putative c-di-GMP-specific phosphodiesterase class I)
MTTYRSEAEFKAAIVTLAQEISALVIAEFVRQGGCLTEDAARWIAQRCLDQAAEAVTASQHP